MAMATADGDGELMTVKHKLHDRQAWQWIGGAQWANNK
jgi:hypothetical protein